MKIPEVVSLILLALVLNASAYMSATMHHDLGAMEDLDENGFPDDLEAYMAGATNLPAGYDFSVADTDLDGLNDLAEWIMGTDPLAAGQHQSTTPVASTNGAVALNMRLPAYFGAYAEIFGRNNLQYGSWEVVDGWIPTYGAEELLWFDVVRSNTLSYFFMTFDATMDFDGDGYSDFMEHYINLSDPYVYDSPNEDSDDLPDFWEIKLFGDIWTQDGFDDSDSDTLLNNQELVWLSGNIIQMYSDPSLYDTDGDLLNDREELDWGTSPLKADTDGDGNGDGAEVWGSPPTDPNNPDIIPPAVTFN